MPNPNNCSNCGKSLANKKSHARSCSGACRAKTWRQLQSKPVSVKINLTKFQFETLKRQATIEDLLINQLIVSRALNSTTNSSSEGQMT